MYIEKPIVKRERLIGYEVYKLVGAVSILVYVYFV
jgi:hypothetical protein